MSTSGLFLNLLIYEPKSVNPKEFVKFWSPKYFYPDEHKYTDNIGRPLTRESVRALFEWKNTTKNISKKKEKSIWNNYVPALDHLPNLLTISDGQKYIKTLKGGAIWNIFWLHCINHILFPIFDQHTYRAMAAIEDLSQPELPNHGNTKIAIYFNQYIPFFNKFEGISYRDIDKALFAYGKYLKTTKLN